MITLKVEDLSKSFILNHNASSLSLRDAANNLARVLLGKKAQRNAPASEVLWALKGLSFELEAGQCLGVLGSNGSGKSTLLKVLSRVISPTLGVVSVKGRMASLLEVGTGFHPDLTGRENVFLNGALLGIPRNVTQTRMDRILDFAEVHQFIDTPVKYYSSGMYVRLAFAVAINLEPNILIVDEVLAVGDEAFQEKCLTHMEQFVARGGTLLFVSHNYELYTRLCTDILWLDRGVSRYQGKDIVQCLADFKATY